ncbi:MAG: CdaR family protein [Lachnospiraceae bacterium]
MKKKLMNNWSLKLLSLVFAFFIWLSVVSYSNPISTYTISGIPVEFEHEELITERGLSVEVVGKQTATIAVTVNRETSARISADDFKAVADFQDMYQDTQVPVTVTCMTGKVSDSNIDLRTRSIEVKLESLTNVTVPITANVTGEPASGYAIGNVTTNPETVTVRAPESVAHLVRSAVVDVDASDLNETTTLQAELKFYDGNGELLDLGSHKDTMVQLTGLVKVTIPVMAVQSVTITPEVQGIDAVAPGYRYTGVDVNPDKIRLSGLKADMNRITSIDVTELDVTGASETQTVTVDIRRYLPEGVEIFDDNYEVTFTLKIEPLRQRTFTLETNTLIINDIPEQLTYSIQESSVSLTISGLEEDLDQLEANGLKASISLRGLAAGEHKVLVTPILTGGGYGQVGTSQITVTLVDPNASSEAETSASAEENAAESSAAASAGD